MTSCEVHILCYNESVIMPFTLLHYSTFCSRMVVHDLGSTDASVEIAERMGAVVKQHDTGGKFDDMLNKRLKQEQWKGTNMDWVIVADADEILYFPYGALASLTSYEEQGVAVVKPYGYEMFSDAMPTGGGQIYHEIKHGAPDNRWYSKPVLFSAKLVKHMEFSTGAHTVSATLNSGETLTNPTMPSNPAALLLHFHHIGGLERIAAKYDAARARYSEANIKHGWGTREAGIKHATDKRTAIMAGLQRVIA